MNIDETLEEMKKLTVGRVSWENMGDREKLTFKEGVRVGKLAAQENMREIWEKLTKDYDEMVVLIDKGTDGDEYEVLNRRNEYAGTFHTHLMEMDEELKKNE